MSFTTGQLKIGDPATGYTKVDQTQRIWDGGSFNFAMTRGQRGQASIPLVLLQGDTYDPNLDWGIWIYELDQFSSTSECVFVGTVEDRDIDYHSDENLRVFTLTALSLEQQYDTQPCPDIEFNNTDAGTMVTTLFGFGSSVIPVGLGTIDAGVFIVGPRAYSKSTTIWAAIKQLAVDSNFIAYIDPRDQLLYFHAHDTRPSGFTLISSDIIFGTIKYRQSRSDVRKQQVVQATPGSLAPITVMFAGDGVTTAFTLPIPVGQVMGAAITSSVAGTATGTFSGVPSDGDTITIGSITYTMRTVIDNTVAYEVLIAGTAAGNAANLSHAIDADASTSTYSAPTLRNPSASAVPAGANVDVTASAMGTAGNNVSLSKTGTQFSWSSATITGGVDAAATPVTVYVSGTQPSSAAGEILIYTTGSASISVTPAPEVGFTLIVTYLPLSGSQLATGGGSPYQISTPQNVSTPVDIAQQATAILTGFFTAPGEFTCETYRAGIYCGAFQPVALTVPTEAAARLNGNWLTQDLHAEWIAGFENLEGAQRELAHFKYTVHFINSTQFNPYQETLQRLVSPTKASGALAPAQQPVTGGEEIAATVYEKPLELSNVTVADDISPHVTISMPPITLSPPTYRVGIGERTVGVLRKAITADLTVRFNLLTNGSPPSTVQWTATIPNGTPVNEDVYTYGNKNVSFHEGDILWADVIASDGQATDANGIATFTVVWG